MVAAQNEQEFLLDGEILIYIRDGAKKRTWQVRFRNPLADKPRYIRESTKTESKSLAIERAISKYRDYQSRKFLGLTSGSLSIGRLLEMASSTLSDTDYQMAQTANRIYWSKYMGDEDISKWRSADWKKYFIWRIKEQTGREEGGYFKPSDTSVSASTLKLERVLLQKLTRFGYQHDMIARLPVFPQKFQSLSPGGVHKLPSNNRRGRFSDEQYSQILAPEFRRIRRQLEREENQPKPKKEDEPWDKESNPYISVAKRMAKVNVQKRMDDDSYKFTCQRPRYNHAQFWFISLLIANTGIRPAEIVKLRHEDFSVREDPDDGRWYTMIRITRETSKVGKYREVIARDFHQTWERYQIFKRETEFYFNVEVREGDWLLPRSWLKGQLRYDLRVDRLNNIMRPHLQRIGLHKTFVDAKLNKTRTQSVEVYYSAYSFRAYYITKRLEEGLNIYTLSKNAGVSIQTIMSTYDYSENWAYRDEMTKHFKALKDEVPSEDSLAELRLVGKSWHENIEKETL